MPKHVLVPVADGSEDIELSCLTDILHRGELKVTLASVMGQKEVKLAHGLKLTADALITEIDAKDIDAVLLPGGLPGSDHLGASEPLKKLLLEIKAENKLYGAICAAPVLSLGPLGLLDGVECATCYPSLESKLPASVKHSTDCVVLSGKCLTSRGPGTALLYALAAVALLRSREVAKSLSKDLLLEGSPELDLVLNL